MMNETQKQKALDRLRRIEGQVRGIQKMISEDRYCMDIMTQTRSIYAAVRGVEAMVMENHLRTCVTSAIQLGTPEEQNDKIQEIMEMVAKSRKND
ncbi:MAG: metal-sensitive transcriptional regulator [Spirochaeta sp.]